MEKDRKLLKIGGILSVIYGSLLFTSGELSILGLINIILGIILLVYQNKSEEELFLKRKSLMAIGIISFITNFVTAILVVIAHENISKYSKNTSNIITHQHKVNVEKEKISPEAKKIDILLKIGISLVVLSGIIFSTSNWAIIPDVIKPVFMILLSVLFASLSYFFKNKIVIKKSEITYDMLSKIFIVCFVISIGYFESFGNYLSFNGEGKNLMSAIVLFTITVVSYVSKRKYNKPALVYISYFSALLSINAILNHFELNEIEVVFIFSLITMFLMWFNKTKKDLILDNVLNILIIFLTIIFVSSYVYLDKLQVMDILTAISILAILLYKAYYDNKFIKAYKVAYPAVLSFIVSSTVYILFKSIISYYEIIIFALMMPLLFVFSKVKNKEESYSGMISSLVLIYLSLSMLFADEMYLYVMLSLAILISFIVYILHKHEDSLVKKSAVFIQLAAVGAFINSAVYYYDYTINPLELPFNTTIQIFLVSFGILTFLQRKIYDEFNLSKVFYYFIICSLALVSTIFMKDHSIIFNLIIVALVITYKILSQKYTESKYDYALKYILIIYGYMQLFNIFYEINFIFYGSVISFIIFLVLSYFSKTDKKLSSMLLIASYVPFLLVMKELTIDSNIYLIMTRLPAMLLCFIFTKMLFVSKNKTKFILEIILLSFIFMSYIFKLDILIGLFTGILAIVMMFIGFKYEKFNSLFYIGIGVTIANIIIQLFEYWSRVPIFVYLLISGLLLIGFVTYKELNKDKQKDEKTKKLIYEEPFLEQNKEIKNVLSIIGVMLLIPCFSYNYYNFKLSEIEKANANLNSILSRENINTNKIYYKNSYYGELELYVEDGYKVDMEKFIELYNKERKYISSVNVHSVSFDSLKKVKNNNKNWFDELFYYRYEGVPDVNHSINGINFKVINEKINYLSYSSSCYDNCQSIEVLIYYNKFEEESLNVCITNYDKNLQELKIVDYFNDDIKYTMNENELETCFNIISDGAAAINITNIEQANENTFDIDTDY